MIGNKIRYFRKKNNLTLEKLSEGICSISYLSKIERGEKADADIINLLCEKLNITTDEELNLKKETLYNNLMDWYTKIKQGHYIEEQDLIAFQNTYQRQGDLNILALFYLIQLRYFLFMKDLSKCELLINDIELLKPQLTVETKFYYFKFLGLYYYLNGNLVKSLELYKEIEYITDTLNVDKIEIADVYFQISLIYIKLNQIVLSIDYCRKASTIFESKYRLIETAECQAILGINYRKVKAYVQAHHHLENLHHISFEINNLVLLSSYHHNMGYLLSCENKSSEAIEHYSKAITLRTKLKSIHKNIPTIYLLSKELMKSGNNKKALYWIEKGLDLASENKEYLYHLEILKLMVTQDPKVKPHLVDAIDYFKNANLYEYASEYAEILGHLYSKEFRYKEASMYYYLANEFQKLM